VTAPTMANFKEKTALVTGASSGVGRAIALELAALGVAVLLVARTPQKLEAVAEEIRRANGQANVFVADLTDDASLNDIGSKLKGEIMRLDFLIHSAALFQRAPVATASVADFDALYRCNVRAPFLLTQMLLPQTIASRGAIAFINSTAGERALANVSQYAATKHALKAIADSLRLENAIHGVRVLSVMLGRTATPMQEEVARLEGVPYEPSRFLQPQDVARAVVNALTLPAGAEVTDLHLRPTHT
jgi:NADP-dependent 3-hydroxy acid dehydrogenase YdfG